MASPSDDGESTQDIAALPSKIIMLESQMEQVLKLLGNIQPTATNIVCHAASSQVLTPEEIAAEEQKQCPFDKDDIYETLRNPYERQKKELVSFGNTALSAYKSDQNIDICERFVDDFKNWNEKHFLNLSKSCIVGIRDLLLQQGCNIRKAPGFPMAKALHEFLVGLKSSSGTTSSPTNVPPGRDSSSNRFPWISPQAPSQFGGNTAMIPGNKGEADCDHSREQRNSPRPSYVSKLFSRDLMYSGSPTEPLRRRYSTFMDACELCGIQQDNHSILLKLLQNVFLKDVALVYYMDKVKPNVNSAGEAISRLESHFLGHRAKRVNDEVWNELSFEFVKKSRGSKNLSITNEDVLNDLFKQITNLSDMRTGPGDESIILGKIISSVREIPIFGVVCQNPPELVEDLSGILRSCALEEDRKVIRAGPGADAFNATEKGGLTMMDALALYVDRQLHKRGHAPFKGYGKGPRKNFQQWRRKKFVPPDTCIICNKKGCHSSKHNRQSHSLLSYMATVFLGDGLDSDIESSDSEESDDDSEDAAANVAVAYHVNSLRSEIYMGISKNSLSFIVDGAVIDTGSSILSTIGNDLVQGAVVASCLKTQPVYGSNTRTIGGIGNSVKTLGTLKFYFMFGSKVYKMILHILPGSTPMLMCHKDLDSMGFNYQTLKKRVTRISDKHSEKVIMRRGLPFLMFTQPSYFTISQLRSMHRNLGHPSVNKHMKIIESAEIPDLPKETRKQIENLVKHCKACQIGRGKPRRFLFSIKDACTGEFNNVVEVDVMKLEDGNVLHVLCTGTLFQQEAWKSLRRCWINNYSGAPDVLVHDQGSNFTGSEFKTAADELGIVLKGIPTEAHERIGALERRHAVVRSVYNKLKYDLPKISAADRLSLVFRAINDVPDSDTGVCPTTMVFGVYPKLPKSGNRGSMAERARIISECTALAIKLKARRIVKDSIRKYHSPNIEEIEKVRRLPPGSDVLVYREKTGWTQYKLASVSENEVKVTLPSGKVSSFGIHNVRQLHDDETPRAFIGTMTSDVFFGKEKSPESYHDSRMFELNGLMDVGTFEVVPKELSEGHRLYSCVFVDKTKSDGSKKSRFCVAAYNDDEHRLFTAAPTVKRGSLRLLISLCTMYGLPLHTRDVSKAFVQSTTILRRPVYVRAPKELGVGPDILKVNRPLYGMPESPMHWYSTYLSYHKEKLGMSATPLDNCLLYSKRNGVLSGIIGLQVDDTLVGGKEDFLSLEEEMSKTFPNSGRSKINDTSERFNGLDISQITVGYRASQEKYISEIPSVDLKKIDFVEFRSLRAKYAYVAYSTMPEILVHVALLSQVTADIFVADRDRVIKLLKKLIQCGSPSVGHVGLTYIKVNVDRAEVFVCFDAAFATNRDYTSQLGVIVLLRDPENGECNVIHYTSTKSKRICRSVLSSELFALLEGFDIGYTIRDTVKKCTGREDIKLTLATDSKSLFSLSITLAQTTEKRLLIDLSLIREAYEKRDINDIIWIPGNSNPADGLTKVSKRNSTLAELIATNKFNPTEQSWVQRDTTRSL